MSKKYKPWEELTLEEKVEMLRIEKDRNKIKVSDMLKPVEITLFLFILLFFTVVSLDMAYGIDDLYHQNNFSVSNYTKMQLDHNRNEFITGSNYLKIFLITSTLAFSIAFLYKGNKFRKKHEKFLNTIKKGE